MSILAAEAPVTPLWAGRLVVRAAGRPLLLHIGAAGAAAPVAAMFTVPLECCSDQEQAPGVRPWNGPVDEARVCPSCLRSLRGEPEPAPPRLVAAAASAAPVLPDPEPDRGSRRLWVVPALQTYAEAPLPREHGGRPIAWSVWTKAPQLHCISNACEWCGDSTSGEMAGGRQGNPLSRTNPLRRYVAYRCSACQDMTAYEQVGHDLKTISRHTSRAPKDFRR